MSSSPASFLSDAAAKLAATFADMSASANVTGVTDIKKNLGALLAAQISKLNLVSREEFDIQTAMLAKAQAKLATLEAKLADYESASHKK